MKLLYILLVVVPLALATEPPTTDKTACKCALVKCVSTQPEVCISDDLDLDIWLHSLDAILSSHMLHDSIMY